MNKWGWDAYSWQLSDEGVPEQVGCPGGQVIVLLPGQGAGRWLARFDEDVCAQCPFFDKACWVKRRKRIGPTLFVTTRSIQMARLRQRITATNNGVCAGVEATVRSVKHPFPGGKLPVRGLIRAHMVVCGSALMVNVHRLCQYFREQVFRVDAEVSVASILVRLGVLVAIIMAWYRHWAATFAHRPVFLPESSVFAVAWPSAD
ncbi:MAG: hypothetical protein H6650_11930 [Ardenticatenales bacterium]|nr:hypothetical protein [Ardenticatenales bacterium]